MFISPNGNLSLNIAVRSRNCGIIGLSASAPRAAALLESRYDKIVDGLVMADWSNASNGDVESPTGAYALIEINSRDDREFWSAVESVKQDLLLTESDHDTVPAPGWYISQRTSSGILYTFEFENETYAREVYSLLENEYAAWCGEGPDDSDDECPTCGSAEACLENERLGR